MKVRLKGGTLVETIVALVIILVIFGIVTTVLVQITMSTASLQHLQAIQLANGYASETEVQRAYFDEETVQEGFTIKRTVVPYRDSRRLVQIVVAVYDRNNHLLEQQKRLMVLKQ